MKFNKVTSLVLSIVMIIGTTTNIFASESDIDENMTALHMSKIQSVTKGRENIDSNQLVVKTLKDISGNTFELVETGRIGYYIFDPESGRYIEYSDSSPSPYLDFTSDLYYFGPTNYYVNDGGVFEHTILDNEQYDENEIEEIQEDFDIRIDNSREIKDEDILEMINTENNSMNIKNAYSRASTITTYVPSYSYVKNAIHPKNSNNTCGYTAATIVLNYWNKMYPSKKIIPAKFLDSSGNLKTGTGNLQDELLAYGNSTTSWALDIKNVLNTYCKNYNVSGTASYYMGQIYSFDEIQNGRPVILFGSLPDVSSSGKLNHAVTAYGMETSYLGDTLQGNFIVNYGWGSPYTAVKLDSGIIGSNTRFRLN